MELHSSDWFRCISTALTTRDTVQKDGYRDIFNEYGNLRENIIQLFRENRHLEIENNHLKHEKTDLLVKLEKLDLLKSHDNDQKVLQLQEELTNRLRKENSLADKVIDLNKSLQERDEIIQSKTSKITELECIIEKIKLENNGLLEKMSELRNIHKTLAEEHESSKDVIDKLNAKLRGAIEERDALMQQLMVLQKRVEELKDVEHDIQYKKKQEFIRRNLEEAAAVEVNAIELAPPDKVVLPLTVLPQRAIAKIDANEGEVNSVRFTYSGKSFGTAGLDRKLRLWNIVGNQCELQTTLVGCNAAITAIDFDPNDHVVLGASNDFSCRIWTLNDSRLRVNLTGHSDRVVSAKFMQSANRVVTASSDRTIKFWDVDRCRCVRTLMPTSGIQDVISCHHHRAVLSGHFDERIRVWDERSGDMTNQIKLSGRVTGLDLSADLTHVLACTRNNTLELINLQTGKVVQCYSADEFRTGLDCVRPCLSPCMRYAAVGGHNGGIFIWNTDTGKLETCLRGHENTVVCCHWNPIGYSLVSCERISRVIVWAGSDM